MKQMIGLFQTFQVLDDMILLDDEEGSTEFSGEHEESNTKEDSLNNVFYT